MSRKWQICDVVGCAVGSATVLSASRSKTTYNFAANGESLGEITCEHETKLAASSVSIRAKGCALASRVPCEGACGRTLPFRADLNVIASRKNLQLLDAEGALMLQLARQHPTKFALEFKPTLGPFLAFAAALARIHSDT